MACVVLRAAPMDTLPSLDPPPDLSLDPTVLGTLLAIEYLPTRERHRLFDVAEEFADAIAAWPLVERQAAARWVDGRRRPPRLVEALPGWRGAPTSVSDALVP